MKIKHIHIRNMHIHVHQHMTERPVVMPRPVSEEFEKRMRAMVSQALTGAVRDFETPAQTDSSQSPDSESAAQGSAPAQGQ